MGRRLVTVYGFAFLAFIVSSTAGAAPAVFRLAGDGDEAPFGFVDGNGVFQGIYVDIIREAFNRMTVPVRHEPYPWARAQMLVRTNEADGMITVVTEDRLTFTEPSREALVELTWVAFTRNDNPDLERVMNAKTIADFKGLKILDYIGDGWGEKNLSVLDVYRRGSLSQTLIKLASRPEYVFIQMSQTTRDTIKQLSKWNLDMNLIVESKNALDRKPFVLLVSKKSPFLPLLPKFDETIRAMRADGSIAKIYGTYQ